VGQTEIVGQLHKFSRPKFFALPVFDNLFHPCHRLVNKKVKKVKLAHLI